MKRFNKLTAITSIFLITASLMPAFAVAATDSTTKQQTNTTGDGGKTDQQRLANLKTKGDAEINRRLATLNKLSAAIKAATKLSAADKASLTTQVNNEIANLNNLKSKLDADTDLATARTDVKSIVSDYRVYALIAPKVYLLRAADSELANDDRLSALATKLQAAITTAKTAGKDVTSLQNTLNDMISQIAAAKAIAMSVEAKVAPLQPTDYNADHTILAGQRDQLKTAHQDNEKAYKDAKLIAAGLKNLH